MLVQRLAGTTDAVREDAMDRVMCQESRPASGDVYQDPMMSRRPAIAGTAGYADTDQRWDT